MRNRFLVCSILALLFSAAARAETLYNGIVLPAEWPPKLAAPPADPVIPPYLKDPPAVIPIDVGRQLFVDDFLVEKGSTLKQEMHLPKAYEKPVHRQMSFSGGICYDPSDKLFKMWYDDDGLGYATSTDGKTWQNAKKGTLTDPISSSIWMDLDEKDPAKRMKAVYVGAGWAYRYRYSPDGIKWTNAVQVGFGAGDRGTAFYNPFRKVWVFSIRLPMDGRRARFYWETHDLEKGPYWKDPTRTNAYPWVGADSADLPLPELGVRTQLYNLDAVAYESLMVGFFCIWHGDMGEAPLNTKPTDKARLWKEQGRDKVNLIKLGFSRDGWHWARPDRRAFIAPSDDPKAWNFANVQSVTGSMFVIGDKLYIYHSGRQAYDPDPKKGNPDWNGLVFLRRDGFASMNADAAGGALTTRPVSFKGKCLFVNVDAPEGELRVEVLDQGGNVIAPFSKDKCKVVKADSTMQAVTWDGAADLSALANKTVKFRFHLKNGKLYSFWVSPDESGSSQGYVAAGGPGFTGHRDTVGKAAYEAAKAIP
jgi:hypothetical protein